MKAFHVPKISINIKITLEGQKTKLCRGTNTWRVRVKIDNDHNS